MKPIIHLALTHDWELRGDGSGDIEQIQFAPMRRLLKLYGAFGIRTTFLPDVMQQLAFRQLESRHPELRKLADSWNQHVRDAYQQGHDVQLHLHSQWIDAVYDSRKWQLRGEWSILDYEPGVAYRMLESSKKYLQRTLVSIDPGYRCQAFRASALAIAPSPHLLQQLVNLGITLDVSLAPGLHLNTQHVQLDYRECDSTFLPFYPQMDDARRISRNREPIICAPIHTFRASRYGVSKQNLSLVGRKIKKDATVMLSRGDQKTAEDYGNEQWLPKGRSSRLAQAYEKVILPGLKGKHFVSDTARLNYSLLSEMLKDIRRRASAYGFAQVPVVLINHPKEISDYTAIERFISEAARADDIKFITLSELASKLQNGDFYVARRSDNQ
jgi:hypothetical protein